MLSVAMPNQRAMSAWPNSCSTTQANTPARQSKRKNKIPMPASPLVNSSQAGNRKNVGCKYSGIPKNLPIWKERNMKVLVFVEKIFRAKPLCLCARMVHSEGFFFGPSNFFSSFACFGHRGEPSLAYNNYRGATTRERKNDRNGSGNGRGGIRTFACRRPSSVCRPFGLPETGNQRIPDGHADQRGLSGRPVQLPMRRVEL